MPRRAAARSAGSRASTIPTRSPPTPSSSSTHHGSGSTTRSVAWSRSSTAASSREADSAEAAVKTAAGELPDHRALLLTVLHRARRLRAAVGDRHNRIAVRVDDHVDEVEQVAVGRGLSGGVETAGRAEGADLADLHRTRRSGVVCRPRLAAVESLGDV